jgi:hypothetical protein
MKTWPVECRVYMVVYRPPSTILCFFWVVMLSRQRFSSGDFHTFFVYIHVSNVSQGICTSSGLCLQHRGREAQTRRVNHHAVLQGDLQTLSQECNTSGSSAVNCSACSMKGQPASYCQDVCVTRSVAANSCPGTLASAGRRRSRQRSIGISISLVVANAIIMDAPNVSAIIGADGMDTPCAWA